MNVIVEVAHPACEAEVHLFTTINLFEVKVSRMVTAQICFLYNDIKLKKEEKMETELDPLTL